MSPSSTPTTMKASRPDMFSKYPRASSSSIRFSTSMCHQLVSSHGPDGSWTRVWAPDLTHPRSTAVSCRRSAKVVSSDPLFAGPRPNTVQLGCHCGVAGLLLGLRPVVVVGAFDVPLGHLALDDPWR